ncbi:hypothetical protein FB595_102262 [Sphingobium sp. AEW010]|nr:hypothetical protein [Sphingobium sp. JAI105]TWD11595.1 hypothetical protein FB595_102262 [Sphingobium sp. AEW010]TWD28514.1 hypothetical protein FB596_10284 [Sphingobium sp. AEW013]TWD30137.1 hypothetical protein FB594_102262 [Sphingobium sp. AEW001]
MTVYSLSAAAKSAAQSGRSATRKGGTGFPPSREYGANKEIVA